MTKNLWRMLELVEHYSEHGYSELECQWGEYAPRTDRDDDMTGFHLTALVVRNMVKNLIRRGLVSDPSCPTITEAGVELLKKHRGEV